MKGKKTGGRTLGSKNKQTQVTRTYLNSLLNDHSSKLSEALNEVFITDKKAYIGLILKLCDMVIPRLEPVSADSDIEPKEPHVFVLSKNNSITFNGTGNNN